MIFKIHYSVGDYKDEVIIDGDSIEEVREKANNFTESRGIDVSTCWSEQID